MSESDSDIGSPRHPAHALIFGSSTEQYLISEVLLSASSSDRSARAQFLAERADILFENHRFARVVHTFPYDGDLVGNMYGTSPDASKHWSTLAGHERTRRWHSEFRMSEEIFEQLFEQCERHFIVKGHRRNEAFREYSTRAKLLMTLHYLAYVPTLRDMSTKFGVPHNSLSVCILRPSLDAMYECLFVEPDTKVIKFPRTKEELDKALNEEGGKFTLPGCIGAIDGSLIPCKKPTKKQADGDTDAYYGYKGFISTLLLAVVDTFGRFIYVLAGAPGCCGDTGLFGNSSLKALINTGVLLQSSTKITIGPIVHDINPYMVGDAAFTLQPYMQVGHRPAPTEDSPKGKYNRNIINSRRTVECTFGRLKGRWQFCNSNCHQNDPEFLKVAVVVSCCLHNFLETRNAEFDDELLEHVDPEVVLPVGNAHLDSVPAGKALRELLTAWSGRQ